MNSVIGLLVLLLLCQSRSQRDAKFSEEKRRGWVKMLTVSSFVVKVFCWEGCIQLSKLYCVLCSIFVPINWESLAHQVLVKAWYHTWGIRQGNKWPLGSKYRFYLWLSVIWRGDVWDCSFTFLWLFLGPLHPGPVEKVLLVTFVLHIWSPSYRVMPEGWGHQYLHRPVMHLRLVMVGNSVSQFTRDLPSSLVVSLLIRAI